MKTAIITGASKGIGLATAILFCNEGYRVINISRSPATDDRIDNIAIDLDRDNTQEQLDASLGNLGGESIVVVHNAAALVNDSVFNVKTDDFRRIINVNVVGPHLVNQAVLPQMQQGSAIIYLGSTLSEKAVANSFSYVTSKHAVVGMMRATCQDLAGTGIHTCCICPGFTDTKMLRTHIDHNPEILNSLAGMTTFNRLIEPEEIAKTILFAAENQVINGAVIHANLGQIES